MSSSRPAPRVGVELDLHLEMAEEFMKALDPMADLWKGKPSAWIFRGQADAGWDLVSSAFRKSNPLASFGFQFDPDDQRGQSGVHALLGRFRERLDLAGIALPVPLPELTGGKNAGAVIHTVMALAQHHGLPTNLLDWTRQGRVAGYFAASDAAPSSDATRSPWLAVWALRCARSNHAEGCQWFEIYQAPGATNPNLRAQSGVFTLQLPDRGLPIEGVVQGHRERNVGSVELRRLTMPCSEAPKLLRLLAYQGVDGSTMFPGVDGVVRAMREEALWDEPPSKRL
jgi:hypothetical protein